MSDPLLWCSMFCTQFVATLYGAGYRRPFGTLRGVAGIPETWWDADRLVLAADLGFIAFILTMWVALYVYMPGWEFLLSASLSFILAGWVTERTYVLPSLRVVPWIAAAAVLCICAHGLMT